MVMPQSVPLRNEYIAKCTNLKTDAIYITMTKKTTMDEFDEGTKYLFPQQK